MEVFRYRLLQFIDTAELVKMISAYQTLKGQERFPIVSAGVYSSSPTLIRQEARR
ncbi:hypothetical protein SSYIS1_01820 [Serratia symbiotica]|uniref:Uncharacterized protein n=1 Tax=Serratia symbiotica TaxID=138074 RepID=A0A455VM34_9GAMM|nr:hypothetical protein SSYIS1_01820 [Serratia symbiotica]